MTENAMKKVAQSGRQRNHWVCCEMLAVALGWINPRLRRTLNLMCLQWYFILIFLCFKWWPTICFGLSLFTWGKGRWGAVSFLLSPIYLGEGAYCDSLNPGWIREALNFLCWDSLSDFGLSTSKLTWGCWNFQQMRRNIFCVYHVKFNQMCFIEKNTLKDISSRISQQIS